MWLTFYHSAGGQRSVWFFISVCELGRLSTDIKEVGAWRAYCWPFPQHETNICGSERSQRVITTVTWKQEFFCLPSNWHHRVVFLFFILFPPTNWTTPRSYFRINETINVCRISYQLWNPWKTNTFCSRCRSMLCEGQRLKIAFWVPECLWGRWSKAPSQRLSENRLSGESWRDRGSWGRFIFILSHFQAVSIHLQCELPKQPSLDSSVTGECCCNDM